jgi:hypothetical protein
MGNDLGSPVTPDHAGDHTTMKAWAHDSDFDPAWSARSAYVARYLPAQGTVIDVGCGQMALEKWLSPMHTYVPVDLHARDERTTLVDLNHSVLPSTVRGDVAVVTGVLEYLEAPRNLVASMTGCGVQRVIVSYCTSECQPDIDVRRYLSWRTHFSEQAVVDLFAPAFRCLGYDRGFAGHVIFLFDRAGTTGLPPAAARGDAG